MENRKPRIKFTNQFKDQLVLEYLKGAKSQAEICRENTINPGLFGKWCRQFEQNIARIFEAPECSERVVSDPRLCFDTSGKKKELSDFFKGRSQ